MSEADAIARTRALLDEVEAVHEKVNGAAYEVGVVVQGDPLAMSEEEMTDVGFLFKRCEDLLDDARKEAKSKREQLGRILAARITKRVMAGDGEARAHGELATAVPDVKMRPVVPRPGSPEYRSFLASLGVSAEMIETGVIQLHWTHLSDWLTKRAAEGLPQPPEMAQLRPDSMVSFRARRKKE